MTNTPITDAELAELERLYGSLPKYIQEFETADVRKMDDICDQLFTRLRAAEGKLATVTARLNEYREHDMSCLEVNRLREAIEH